MDAESFGKYIRELRTSKKMTMQDLSEETGISQPYLSMLENGKKGMPQRQTISKIAIGLKISPAILLEKAGHTKFYIDEVWNDDIPTVKTIEVQLPSTETVKSESGGTLTKELSDEEMRRRLFDIHDYFNLDVDLYYKNEYLTKEKRAKIKKIFDISLSLLSDDEKLNSKQIEKIKDILSLLVE